MQTRNGFTQQCEKASFQLKVLDIKGKKIKGVKQIYASNYSHVLGHLILFGVCLYLPQTANALTLQNLSVGN